MATWKSKICRGMDIVETITYTRSDIKQDGTIVCTSAVYIPGANEEKTREEWTQDEIDAIGETLVKTLDAELERLKTTETLLPTIGNNYGSE